MVKSGGAHNLAPMGQKLCLDEQPVRKKFPLDAVKYMLRCLGCKLKGRKLLPVDNNLDMIQSTAGVDSRPKKEQVALSFHKLRECMATGIVHQCKRSTLNLILRVS